jgi:hypothetical protein
MTSAEMIAIVTPREKCSIETCLLGKRIIPWLIERQKVPLISGASWATRHLLKGWLKAKGPIALHVPRGVKLERGMLTRIEEIRKSGGNILESASESGNCAFIRVAIQATSRILVLELPSGDDAILELRGASKPGLTIAAMDWPIPGDDMSGARQLIESGVARSIALYKWSADLREYLEGVEHPPEPGTQLSLGI